MATTALSWFYCKPETTCYEVAERVRATFWDARLTALWLDCVSADSPYHLRGRHGQTLVQMEWDPGRSLALRTTPTDQPVAEAVTHVLKLKPAFRYRDTGGAMVWEWHTDGGEKRWQAIQGRPGYHAPVRLNR